MQTRGVVAAMAVLAAACGPASTEDAEAHARLDEGLVAEADEAKVAAVALKQVSAEGSGQVIVGQTHKDWDDDKHTDTGQTYDNATWQWKDDGFRAPWSFTLASVVK